MSIDWRLFIDSSKRSQKDFPLNNDKWHSSVSVPHSVQMKETFENSRKVLNRIDYSMHELKVVKKWWLWKVIKIPSFPWEQKSFYYKGHIGQEEKASGIKIPSLTY